MLAWRSAGGRFFAPRAGPAGGDNLGRSHGGETPQKDSDWCNRGAFRESKTMTKKMDEEAPSSVEPN